jgi:hypothetical protein
MDKTIIVGNIEFMNRRAVINSVHELYKADSKEEQEALENTFEGEGVDYLVVEDYQGSIAVTKEALVSLLNNSWGVA